MAKNRNPKKPTAKKPQNHNPNAPKPKNPPKNHNRNAPKPENPPKNHNPNPQKPEKTPKKHNPHVPKPENPPTIHNPNAQKPEKTPKSNPKTEKPPTWAAVRSLLSCKHLQPQQQMRKQKHGSEENGKKCKKLKCSGSLCNNTKVMHKPEPSSSSSPENSNKKRGGSSMSSASINNGEYSSNSRSMKLAPLNEVRGMPFRRFSGCYECRMVVDPVLGFTRDPSLRATICTCPECGQIFMKPENLELHQAVRHAVSELGPEDTSKNIVEIIFQSSWLKKQNPVCKIDRILKVQNTPKTISKFEEYRESIKAKSTKKQPRCLADGNELLRFHSTSFSCSLGLNGSSNLCNSIPNCSVCSIIKNGFRASVAAEKGILTTATSGKAHDSAVVVMAEEEERKKRAMLVCRVIAGRVKKSLLEGGNEAAGPAEEYDSVAGAAGVYSNLDELYVFNPRAILPCFVVVYRGF